MGKNKDGNRVLRIAILNRLIREDVRKETAFKQRSEESEEVSHMVI